MLNTKKTNSRNMILWGGVAFLVIAGVIVLSLSLSGRSSDENAQDDVNVVYTNAAETVAAQQLTLQAAAPTATLELFTPTATVTVAPLASATLPIQQPLATSTSSASSGAVGCYNSVFVSDVTIPDNTAVTAGQTFTKKWKLQNNGSCPWTATFKAAFVSGSNMSGVPVPIGVTVDPGASTDVAVDMTAPSASGSAMGYWIMVNDSGQQFGKSFYVVVNVSGTSSTTGTVAATVTAGTVTPGTATPTGTSSIPLPNPANNPDITLSCTLGGTGGTQYEYAGKLTWEDMSTNENGFNIYINGALAAIAPADTTSYKVASVFYDAGTAITYSVESFNAGGKAAQANVTKQCP